MFDLGGSGAPPYRLRSLLVIMAAVPFTRRSPLLVNGGCFLLQAVWPTQVAIGYTLLLGEGSPAVVFESGFGMSSNAWALVQPQIAKFTSACSYDRPGYGWSDEPPQPRTGIAEAADLHRMLANAGVSKPYVLVGHSMGGGQVRLFASRFASDVAGLVIVASGHEDWRTRNPAATPSRG